MSSAAAVSAVAGARIARFAERVIDPLLECVLALGRPRRSSAWPARPAGSALARFAFQAPGGIDDVLLLPGQPRQLAALTAPFFAPSSFSPPPETLAEALFERPDLGEVHVAGGAAELRRPVAILGPEVVREQLVGPRVQVFERDDAARGDAVGLRRRLSVSRTSRGGCPAQAVDHAVRQHGRVVGDLGLDGHLLQRRDPHVAPGKRQRELRRLDCDAPRSTSAAGWRCGGRRRRSTWTS